MVRVESQRVVDVHPSKTKEHITGYHLHGDKSGVSSRELE